MDANKPKSELETKVKEILAELIGTSPKEISDEDSLTEDLHMRPTDITDFFETLSINDVDISKIEVTDIETVGDLVESIISQETIN